MKLADLCAVFSTLPFPGVGDDAHPDRESVLQVRAELREALTTDELLTDCIAHEITLVESDRLRHGLVPFFTMPGRGIRFAFGYWPPGGTPGPHEHTAWTITAVCRNRLDVATFDRAESYRRSQLVPKNRFEARAGEVGFIYEPSIHAPKNTSADWSLSLHIISPRDGQPLPGVEPLPGLTSPASPRVAAALADHPYLRVLSAREQMREADVLARSLLAMRGAAAAEPLARCYRIASSSTRRMIHDALPDRFAAARPSTQLARRHPALDLSLRHDGHGWALLVDAPRGPVKLLRVNDPARAAVAFATAHEQFEVAALPGQLSDDERTAIAETLEDTGIFTRMDP